MDSQAAFRASAHGFPNCRDRRLRRGARRVQEAARRVAREQRHGVHPGSAPRSEPRQFVGGLAGGTYVDGGRASDRRHGDRARSRLRHSARAFIFRLATRNDLRLSKPQARHGARLPFDFLLNSLASEYGARAVCVVLSGTGADGSLGLQAMKAKGGLVIAQDPERSRL